MLMLALCSTGAFSHTEWHYPIEDEEDVSWIQHFMEDPEPDPCYESYDVCELRYPFTQNWSNVNPITVRLNFHFIRTGDYGLNFGEEDGNCPSCPNNENMSIYNVAEEIVQWLNSMSENLDDYLVYYDGNGNSLNPPQPKLDANGSPVPNMGDAKLRFELYKEQETGAVFLHYDENYKIFSHMSGPHGACIDLNEQDPAPIGKWENSYSLHEDEVIDIFLFEEYFENEEIKYGGNNITCRAARGWIYNTMEQGTVPIANLWHHYKDNLSSDPIRDYSYLIFHEIGHLLGLVHTFPNNPQCCDANEAGLLNSGGDSWNVSNNIMGYNFRGRSISPCQIDRMFNTAYNGTRKWVEIDPMQNTVPPIHPVAPPTIINDPVVNWTGGGYLDKEVIVKSGSRLNITNGTWEITNNVSFSVERGAMLYIGSGAVLKNHCPSAYWAGIRVAGNQDRDHPDHWSDPFNPDGNDPGRVIVEGGTIERANVGIVNFYFNVPMWPLNFTAGMGGYIYTDQATFKRCNVGVGLLPMKGKINKSKLLNTVFVDDFPIFSLSSIGIYMVDNVGIEIQGGKFDRMKKAGILALNSGFKVHNGVQFLNIEGTAISAIQTVPFVPSSMPIEIGGNPGIHPPNLFQGNLLDIRIEGYASLSNSVQVKNNHFKGSWNPSTPGINQCKAIEVIHSRVDIKSNFFENKYQGLSFKDTRFVENQIKENYFLDFHTGIWFEPGNNRRTSFICNLFLGNNSSGVFVDNSHIRHQGTGANSNTNEWERWDNYEPAVNVLDIRTRVGPVLELSRWFNADFTYFVQKDIPLIHPERPLCNLSHVISGCSQIANYETDDSWLNECEGPHFLFPDTFSIPEIRQMMLSIKQHDSLYQYNPDYLELSVGKFAAVGKIVDSLILDEQYTTADQVLALESELEYWYQRYGLRVHQADYVAAATFLNTMPESGEEETDFVYVQSVQLQALQDSLFTLDSVQIQNLEYIAKKRTPSSVAARGLLAHFQFRVWSPEFAVVEDSLYNERRIPAESQELEDTNIETEVYPNPSDGIYHIVPGSHYEKEGMLMVRVYNILGQQMTFIPLAPGTQTIQLNLSHLEPGHYLLIIAQNGETRDSKAIIKH
ncbi:MAG: T9SS C-terminal target domain-containing protein [Saprospirales bacterium]|nr:MAG: T9SS C-terminal target domain-containing protein [Saprospirales bacterium]